MEGKYCILPDEWKDWKVVGEIGTGSYGKVYEIQREIFGDIEKAALKVVSIPQNQTEINELISNGYDSAGIAAHFQHYAERISKEYTLMKDVKGYTNIVCCDDLKCIRHSNGLGWDIYIKMELLTPLTDCLGQFDKEINDTLVIQFGMDLCNALIHCKQKNIIHRDIKPQNIFVSQSGNFKLGDFGVAKVVENTISGTQVGTLNYMAPEVYKGMSYDATVDLYSLGLVMYWVLNERRLPFLPLPPQNPTAAELENARLRRFNGEMIPPPAHGSQALKAIVMKACAYAPGDRYASAEEMRRDLEILDPTSGIFVTGWGHKDPTIGPKPDGNQTNADPVPVDPVFQEWSVQGTLGAEQIYAQQQLEEQERLRREQERLWKEQQARALQQKEQQRKKRTGIIVAVAVVLAFVLLAAVAGIALKAIWPQSSGDEGVSISAQPVGVTVAEGERATVVVEAAGEGLQYEWYYRDPGASEFQRVDGVWGNTYTVVMDQACDGITVYCIVTDMDGNQVTTDKAVLEMTPCIQILEQPASITVTEDEKAVVSVKASGEGLTYQWWIMDPGDAAFEESTTKDSTYSVQMNDMRNGRKLYCIITDAHGHQVQTDTVVIDMVPCIQILEQPVSVTVAEDENAVVKVKASGEGLNYQWWIMDPGETAFNLSSTKDSTYSVQMNYLRSGRKLYCIITDAHGHQTKTDTVVIDMIPCIEIQEQPVSVTVAEDEKAVVKVKASGEGLKYQWWIMDVGGTVFTESTTKESTYSVQMNSARSGRKLYCIITDAHGHQTKTDTVVIDMIPCIQILAQPVSVTVAKGENAVVTVKASGEGLTYQWWIMDPGGTEFVESTTKDSTYSVQMNDARNGRKLYCVITDAHGHQIITDTVIIKKK